MDTLSWTNSNLNYSIKKSNKLFFNEYQWSACGYLQEVNSVRGLTSVGLDERLRIKERYKRSGFYVPRSLGMVGSMHREPITDITKENLNSFINFFNEQDLKYRLVLTTHRFYCYSNNIPFLEELLTLPGIVDPGITEIKINSDSGSLVRKNSDYKYRTYLKTCIVTNDHKQKLKQFLQIYHDTVVPCRTFKRWLNFPSKYCQEHFFFDYNDPGIETIFNICAPGLLKKTYNIINEEI